MVLFYVYVLCIMQILIHANISVVSLGDRWVFLQLNVKKIIAFVPGYVSSEVSYFCDFYTKKKKNILNQSVIESWIKMYLLIRIHYSHQVSEQCIFKGYCTSAWLNPESRHWLETMVQGICALCPFSIIYNINMWSPDSTLFDTAWHYDKYSGLGWENTTLFGEGFSPANCPKVWKNWQKSMRRLPPPPRLVSAMPSVSSWKV